MDKLDTAVEIDVKYLFKKDECSFLGIFNCQGKNDQVCEITYD